MRKTVVDQSNPPQEVAIPPDRKAYQIDEARVLLGGLARASIYKLIKDGKLATVMLGGRRLVTSKAIDECLAASLAPPPVGAEAA